MFSAAHPKIEIIAHSGTFEEVHGLFTSGAVDLVFMLSPGEVPGLQTTPIGRYRLAFIAAPGHPLARQVQIAPATLAQHPYVSPYRNSYFGRTLEAMLHDAGVPPPPVRSQAQELSMVRELVLAGRGFSLSMRRSVQKDLAAGTLVELDVDLPPMHLTLVYARNPRAALREIDSLVDLVRESEGRVA
jgi:DNA-binding transcriptional LysR family regulator